MQGAGRGVSRQEVWFMQQAYGLVAPRVVGRISDVMPDGTEIIGVHLCAAADDKTKDVVASVAYFLTSDENLPVGDIGTQEPIIVFDDGSTPQDVRINGAGFVHIWPMLKTIEGSEKRLGIAMYFLGTDPMTINAGILYRMR